MCQIQTDGKGLYLGPTSDKGFETVGNGLYLVKQGGLYDGWGLIWGETVHIKISPSWYDFVIFLSDKNMIYTKNGNSWNVW